MNDQNRIVKQPLNQMLVSDLIPRTRYYNQEVFYGYHHLLYGIWKFERSWSEGKVHTDEPSYQMLEFAKFGLFGKILNNKLIDNGKVNIIDMQAGRLIIGLMSATSDDSGHGRVYHVFITKDTLILQEPCCDGYSILFTRD